MSKSVVFLLVIVLCAGVLKAQDVERDLYRADTYFSIKNYEAALPLYLQVLEGGKKDARILYNTGYCYFAALEINDQIKGIPYFEEALQMDDEVAPEAKFNLADLYLKDEQIDKAISMLSELSKNPGQNDVRKIKSKLKTARTALAMISMARNTQVKRMGGNINTENTEYNPIVSADEAVMAFTALRKKDNRSDELVEEIQISYNSSGSWTVPQPIKINSKFNIGTAGISPDGQQMLIFMGGPNNDGNLFLIEKSGDQWSEPTILSNNVNSKYMETTGSITPDGKTLYFASNRPGGFGGYDIYKSVKMDNGEWGPAENLGPEVNSKANEDAPFIHPDQWTLFFTSDGHNTMGGRDIFVTRLFNGEWTNPENMGYPINTTANDNYFTLTADGRTGYFSSDRKGGAGAQDIYMIEMPEEEANIPLTMIKGKILDAESGNAIPTKIYVIDNESGKKLDFVYQPDPKTGNYLIILPPSRNYDMIIESEGFLPYTLNINIPGQTYFYELYQKILLRTIKQFDVVVGQEVEVKNAFYDTHQEAVSDLRKTHEAALVKNDSVDVYDLMNDLIAAGDDEGIQYLTELLQMSNPVDSVNFDESKSVEQANRIYYYDESDEDKFEKKVIDGKTIFSLPTFHVTEEAEKQKAAGQKQQVRYDKDLLERKEKVYFSVGKSDFDPTYKSKLQEIVSILNQYPELGIEISGYASSEGDPEANKKLSNDRAISVLNFFNQDGRIVRRRIVARGYGETKDEKSTAEESRRVEVRIVDLNNFGRVIN